MSDLTSAVKRNDIFAVKSLLAGGSVDVNAHIADEMNCPLLVLAADLGHVAIVAHLLDAGAQIDDVNEFGDSACHTAARNNHVDVVELLVARNANLTLRNRYNETPIISAIRGKNEQVVMLLVDAAMAAGVPLDDETICHAATVSTDVIRFLLFKHRIDLSGIRDNDGRTPLHEAALRCADASVLDMLIAVAGVDIDDACDKSYCTATHYACAQGDAGALTRLIAAGANLELADERGNTPLHYCTFDSTDQIACCLLAAGVNVHAKVNNGRTTCHRACEWAHASLPALLAFGANLDEPDNDGITPRQLLESTPLPTSEEVELARRRVLAAQLSLVRKRAIDVCVGLQSRGLDALCTCEILIHSCGPVAPFVPFHRWWQIATAVKHFHEQ